MTCLQGGAPNQACVLGCFSNPAAALSAVAALTCITSSCSMACTGGAMEGGVTGDSSTSFDAFTFDGITPADARPGVDASELDATGPGEGGGSADAIPPSEGGSGD
jgi:hypothetical protein